MVPAVVVVVTVPIAFSVGQVVFAVVADQIRQGEAIMGSEEINGAPQGSWLTTEQVRVACKPLS